MDYIIAFILLALSVILWRTNGRNQYQILAGLQALLAVLAFFWLGQDIGQGQEMLLFSLLSGVLVFHFVLSRFWKIKGIYWPSLLVLLSSGIFFLFQKEVFNYGEFGVNLTAMPVLFLPFLGASMETLAEFKEKIIGNYFKIDAKNRRGISRAVYVFLMGFSVFLGHFTASYIGVGLVTLGFGANLFYGKKSATQWNMFLGLIALTSLGHFAKISEFSSVDLLQGRVMEGLFFGGFISLFSNTILRARQHKNIAVALVFLLMVAVPAGLILIGAQFVSLGGPDAFMGILVGFGFAAFLGINTRKNSSALALYFAMGVFLLPMTVNEEAEEMTTIRLNASKTGDDEESEKQTDLFETPGKTIDLTGNFEIDAENSQLTFELGQTGSRTKGAFKTFQGTFNLGTSNSVAVTLPVDKLTTFNSYRDESLMEESYFNLAKYPTMNFRASELELEGDIYKTKGQFTMLGRSKDLIVDMKYIGKTGKNNAPVFIGRAKINRTEFGMKSDPKEGDIVDFLFKVELKVKS